MSDQPEPLSAIIAEMRECAHFNRKSLREMPDGYRTTAFWGDKPIVLREAVAERIDNFADRIEAAAKREQTDLADAHDAIARLEAELAEARRERDSCAAENSLLARPQTGNAAALREALERIVGWCEGCHADACEKVCRPELTSESIHAALAALSAPARNCDRFATVGAAHKAWRATDQERDFADWLFAPAEGGAE